MVEWLGMGGYGAFIWGSYAVALGGLAATTLWAVVAHGRAVRAAKSRETEP